MNQLPGREDMVASVRGALSAMRRAVASEDKVAKRAAAWIGRMPVKARRGALSDPSPGSPPKMPNPAEVLAEARARASKVTAITAGVGAWRETAALYGKHRQGESVTAGMVWDSTKRVGQRAFEAGRAANRRTLTVVGLNTAARVVAWQSARRAGDSAVWKAIHATSSKLAGRAGHVMVAVDVFVTMRADMVRFKQGELSDEDFYRNCALTGVSVLAPMVGATAGPLGATAGMIVSISAGMARK